MRVISNAVLVKYGRVYPDARGWLEMWRAAVAKCDWSGPLDVTRDFPRASVVAGGRRVVFRARGNRYRLIGAVRFDIKAVYVRFFGTDADYGRVDAETV